MTDYFRLNFAVNQAVNHTVQGLPQTRSTMTDAEFLQEVKRSVREIDPQAEIWLFGSRARGDARDDSDWDFLVLTNKSANWAFKRQIRDHLYDVGFAHSHVVSTIIQSKADAPFVFATELYQNVLADGKRL